MPWMDMLYRTYESNAEMAGKSEEQVQLSVVAHMMATAQIEVTVDESGRFVRAVALDRIDGRTIIPVTEASASRSSGIAPHPLCDMMPYVSGDYHKYISEVAVQKKSRAKFEAYIQQLGDWAKSNYSHPKVLAIFSYLSESSLTGDLVAAGVIPLSEEGFVSDRKISGATCDKALVRFRVMGTYPDAVWQDALLFESHTKNSISTQNENRDICYLTGNGGMYSTNHPKGDHRIELWREAHIGK